MNKVAKRLLVFFIGLPLVIAIVSLHYYNHIALNIVATVVSALAANEFYNMARNRFQMFPKTAVIIFTTALPFIAYNFVLLDMDLSYLTWVLVFDIFAFMGAESLCGQSFENSLEKIAVTILIIFYCGFMITFIPRMCSIKEDSTIFIYLFFILVFMCDSGAWFFGILLGKTTRGFFKASPNKSLVGFAGGIITSMACALLFKFLFPVVFYGPFWKILIVAATTALAAIVGDLIESVFKRSCDVKDSGTLIPGRGGLLDCIDSIILGAPIYYMGIHILYLTAKL
ncbi:MAG: phosphatidate cytidylyltransferase [Treponema sp.]|nr:phosphatidate cytidylyltransferase [Treponema sp.]MBO4533237.1 phosphatidate cytidylyltransferase [Treponema sp.]